MSQREKHTNVQLPASDPTTGRRWMQVWAINLEFGLLPPIDDDRSDCFMAFPTQKDAEICLSSQIEKGYIEAGEVVRVA